MNSPWTPTALPPLTWRWHGVPVIRGSTTWAHEHADVKEFTFIPGFTDLSNLLATLGFRFSENSCGHFIRSVVKQYTQDRLESEKISFSFFASIRFTRTLEIGTLTFHRAARGGSFATVDEVARTAALDPSNTASLALDRLQILPSGKTHASLVSLAMFLYGCVLPIAEQFGSMEIPDAKPTKRNPSRKAKVFTISPSTLKALLHASCSSVHG